MRSGAKIAMRSSLVYWLRTRGRNPKTYLLDSVQLSNINLLSFQGTVLLNPLLPKYLSSKANPKAPIAPTVRQASLPSVLCPPTMTTIRDADHWQTSRPQLKICWAKTKATVEESVANLRLWTAYIACMKLPLVNPGGWLSGLRPRGNETA